MRSFRKLFRQLLQGTIIYASINLHVKNLIISDKYWTFKKSQRESPETLEFQNQKYNYYNNENEITNYRT